MEDKKINEYYSFGKEYFEGKMSTYLSNYQIYDENSLQLKKFYEFVQKNCMKMENKKVLEIGCSLGHCLKFLESKGNRVYGIDISSYAVKKAKKLGLRNVYRADIEKTNLAGEKNFDFVYCIDTMEHLNNPRIAVERAFGALKKGGMLLLVTPNKDAKWFHEFFHLKVLRDWPNRDMTHISLLSEKEIKKMFSKKWRSVKTKKVFWGMNFRETDWLKIASLLCSPLFDLLNLKSYILVIAVK